MPPPSETRRAASLRMDWHGEQCWGVEKTASAVREVMAFGAEQARDGLRVAILNVFLTD
jgi:hypothetical protein